MTDTLTTQRTTECYYGETSTPLLLWATTDSTQRIAELWIDPHTHVVRNVWVHESHRGEGHATRLYRQAQADLDGTVLHDVPWHRTDEGSRWAATVGGDSAGSCDCCAHLFDDSE